MVCRWGEALDLRCREELALDNDLIELAGNVFGVPKV